MNTVHLPTRVRSALLMFVVMGLCIHFLPNLGTKVHSDTSWIFRLMAAEDPQLKETIPDGLKMLGAYPQNPFSGFLHWYRATGRFDFGNVVIHWLVARVADDRGDAWRFPPIVMMSAATGLFYLTALEMKIPKSVAFLSAATLFLNPLDVWVMYNNGESKAVLFLMLAIYLVMRSTSGWHQTASAGCMIAAFLCKESFVLFWILIPACIAYRDWDDAPRSLAMRLKGTARRMLPHVAACVLILLFFACLRSAVPMMASYVFFRTGLTRMPITDYLGGYFAGILPVLPPSLYGYALAIFVAGGAFCAFAQPNRIRAIWRRWSEPRSLLVLAALFVCILLHVVPYYLANRQVTGMRYLVPANWFCAMMLALLVSPVVGQILVPAYKRGGMGVFVFWAVLMLLPKGLGFRGLVLAVIPGGLILLALLMSRYIPALSMRKYGATFMVFLTAFMVFVNRADDILYFAKRNRVEQDCWHDLIHEVKTKAPRNGHVVLCFREPLMIELAQSLEANTQLLGRGDLTYHVTFEDLSLLRRESGYIRFSMDAFNRKRKPLGDPDSGGRLYVYAHRNGGVGRMRGGDEIGFSKRLALLRKSWRSFLALYTTMPDPYFQYRISFEKLERIDLEGAMS